MTTTENNTEPTLLSDAIKECAALLQPVRGPQSVPEPLQPWERDLLTGPTEEQLEIAHLRAALAMAQQGQIFQSERADEQAARARVLADERDNALQQRNAFETDLRLTNDALNDTAKRSDWCGEYEERMEDLNDSLTSGFQFRPRTKAYEVEVTMTATFNRWVTVDATSRDDARNIINGMATADVHEKMNSPYNFGDSASDSFEIGDVSLVDD